MSTSKSSLQDTLQEHLKPYGFYLLGISYAETNSQSSHYNNNAQTVVLVGNAGDHFYKPFKKSQEFQEFQEFQDNKPNPLDRYSRKILEEILPKLPKDSSVVMPSDKPYAPFQQWALASGQYHSSPLKLLIHAKFGLWTAFRGALVIPQNIHENTPKTISPCDSCIDKPCLQGCPAKVFNPEAETPYNVQACQNHLADQTVSCWDRQCLARLACPISKDFRYEAECGKFFLRSFTKSQ